MKQIIKIILSAILVLIFTNANAQDAIYIFHDEAYMDKYHYKVENLSSYNYHIAYHIYTSNSEKVILNTAMSSYKAIDGVTLTNTKNLTDVEWTATLINELNNDIKEVFFVFKEGKTYHSYQVSTAIYVEETNNKIMYSGPYYSYTFDKNKLYDPATDLEGGKFSIYDENTIFMNSTDVEDVNCIKQHAFIKVIKDTHPTNSFTMIANDDFTKMKSDEIYETCQTAIYINYLEDIGIIEEKTKNGKISLIGINNQKLTKYIEERCQPKSYNVKTETSVQPVDATVVGKPGLNFTIRDNSNTEKSGEVVKPTNNSNVTIINESTNESSSESEYELIYTMLSNENTEKSITEPLEGTNYPQIYKEPIKAEKKKGSIVHTVDNGETLYSISKKYNVSVKTIQALNNIEDTGIFVTQELIIKE